MLWHKGWLETRFRWLFAMGIVVLFLVNNRRAGASVIVGNEAIVVALLSIMLAGAGINTQPPLQAKRGLHGSTLFTLSLPVSRLRLLAVRAGLGWLEMASGVAILCSAVWILSPALRASATSWEIPMQAVTLIACASGLYSIVVLLATFLDDLWRIYGSAIAFGALWGIQHHTPVLSSADIFWALSQGSPLVAHSIPWTAIAFSVGLAAILFCVALKIARTREY
jgi:ABC-2 type transport system permease protein